MLPTPSEAPFSSLYNKRTLIAALFASSAATITVGLSLPLWIMFLGWIGFSTCAGTPRASLISAICICCGFSIGMLAMMIIGMLSEHIGTGAYSIAVFSVAIVVLSLRSFQWLGNVVAWFLGLVAYFSSLSTPSGDEPVTILLINLFGLSAGYITKQIQQKLT